MDIMELGAIGELVGGVAVIGSLIYVGLQVRQSNGLAKMQVHQEVARMSIDQSWRIDADLARLFDQASADLPGMDPADRLVVRSRFIAIVNYYEMLFYARERGYVDDDLWISRRERLRSNFRSIGPSLWGEWKEEFGSNFRDYVDGEVIPGLVTSR